MTIRRILRVEKPHKQDRNFHGGLYHVWTLEVPYQPWAMFEAEFNLIQFENKMLDKGISEKIIEEHRELVSDKILDDRCMDGEAV